MGSQPAAAAASTRSSPSATNSPSRSRARRPRSLRINFNFSLWGLVIIERKRGGLLAAPGDFAISTSSSGRGGLPGELGKSAEGLRVADGDVGEHLAVHLDPGLGEAVDELGVAHPLAPGGGV